MLKKKLIFCSRYPYLLVAGCCFIKVYGQFSFHNLPCPLAFVCGRQTVIFMFIGILTCPSKSLLHPSSFEIIAVHVHSDLWCQAFCTRTCHLIQETFLSDLLVMYIRNDKRVNWPSV